MFIGHKIGIPGGGKPPLTVASILGASLVADYDARAGVTLGAGSSVAAWADQGPSGYDLTQGTAGLQPTYSASGGPNDVPYISGDGTEYMNNATIDVDQPCTIWCVCLPTVAGNINKGIFDATAPATRRLFVVSAALQVYAGAAFTASTTTTAWQVVRVLFNNTASECQINDDSEVTGTAGVGGTGVGLYVFSQGAGGVPADARITRLVISSADASAAQQADMKAHFDLTYGAL